MTTAGAFDSQKLPFPKNMQKDPALYECLLVTGGKGFIGSHLVDYIYSKFEHRTKIVIVDSLTYCANTHYTCPGAIFECVDICDEKAMMSIILKHRVDGILHLAAESDVSRSFANPYPFLETNVKGTLVLLECMKKINAPTIHLTFQGDSEKDTEHKIKKFLYCSTDEVYGTAYQTKHTEDQTQLIPTNPYSASKASGEMFCQAYFQSYRLNIVISRMNNVYGTRQYPEKVIPRFVSRLAVGLLPQIQGSGQQKRTFLHVKDACRGLFTVFHKGQSGQIYNIGAHEEITILELATRTTQIMNELTGKALKCYFDQIENRPFNDLSYDMSTDRIENELGWKPEISFDEGFPEVVRDIYAHLRK